MPDGRDNSSKLAREIEDRRRLMIDAGHVLTPLYPHEVDQVIAALTHHANGPQIVAGLTKSGFEVFNKSAPRKVPITEGQIHPGGRM
jgi:hypothetical protein